MARILPAVLVPVLALAAAAAPAAVAGDFYVAFAPYLTTTHPCTYHVKGSCQGELAGATFRYWLRSTDGTVSRSGVVRAGKDGFVELWVPPGKRYAITFAYGRRRGTGTFSSFPKDPTCITTIRLR